MIKLIQYIADLLNIPTHKCLKQATQVAVQGHHSIFYTQQTEIESPIYCGAMGPALLMRANLIEHPAYYLCLHHAVSGFTRSGFTNSTLQLGHSLHGHSKSNLATHL